MIKLLIAEHENGFIVAPGDADALASAIANCLANRSHLPTMGIRSAEKAKEWTVARSNAAHLERMVTFIHHKD